MEINIDANHWWSIIFELVYIGENWQTYAGIKREKDKMFGGCHIIFVGDFFQLLPVGGGLPLFKGNTLQFGAINKAIFLNVSHRFDDNHAYGEIMRRLW